MIARFTNETTYIDIDENREHGPQEMETENTTFIVKEILYNSDPNTPLENSVEVQSDGTMVVHKSTVTECWGLQPACCCSSPWSAQDIGNDYLLTINEYGDSFGYCGDRFSHCGGNTCQCRMGERSLCMETATELRAPAQPSSQSSSTGWVNEMMASDHFIFALSFFFVLWT